MFKLTYLLISMLFFSLLSSAVVIVFGSLVIYGGLHTSQIGTLFLLIITPCILTGLTYGQLSYAKIGDNLLITLKTVVAGYFIYQIYALVILAASQLLQSNVIFVTFLLALFCQVGTLVTTVVANHTIRKWTLG